ncbi:unnamed protein product [Fusarium venenatum]|uniref:Uncharacterized protein n=1 Tax=Fusarium venenatum TaxID=56646 RepID=A0A2L2TEV7_9HYPO|nr:unnamed protein product [Fusarium venenatum]
MAQAPLKAEKPTPRILDDTMYSEIP